jgi:hypothetical protein
VKSVMVAILLLCGPLAAGPPDPFVGTWKFVPEQSHFASGRQPKDIRLRFVMDNGRLREEEETIRSNGSTFTATFIHEYDGKEHPIAMTGETKHRTHTVRLTRIDERTVERRINHDSGQQYTTERLALSPDLKTLTEMHVGTGSDGRPYETVETFVRQP